MYCSTCGQKIADNLNYCNNCGARIEKAAPGPAPQMAKGLSVVLMMGFVAFVAVLKIVLDNPRIDMPATVLILVSYLAALTLVAAMYFGFMWKSASVGRDPSSVRRDLVDGYAPPSSSLRGSNTNRLGEPTYEPASSVTDSTTRTLDEVPVSRR